ncbi:glycosyltransferase family 2 protein [Shimia thalassica]|uniref:glycosyltransferase family 2 protein n=1 Tax=Shimia thalassica TaxID=1715693 RepID=UPI0027347160|nr:glycosyltransferase family 2 protein [Shimia thalassica]MDP2518456.1 glycosyltransferase family 2 protein [Shimia thalassica]
MDLSIVIVNWNTREMLRDCLQSVFDTLSDLKAEVFVVDNASEDGSQDMVRNSFPQVNLICNTDNRGFAAANNQALALASGRYVLLLNSDTLVHGDVLSASCSFMDGRPEVGVMGCRVLNRDGTLQITGSGYPSLLNLSLMTTGLWKLKNVPFFDRYQMQTWDRRTEREIDVVSGCYMVVRKTAMDEVGLLDEDFFFYGEETDWCRRFADAGWKLVLSPVGEITHFGGGSVKKLNHKRDVMLTEGTVRLHRKHGGVLGGAACWTLLAGFNLSRSVFWTLASLTGGERAKERASHFRRVVAASPDTWPSASQ